MGSRLAVLFLALGVIGCGAKEATTDYPRTTSTGKRFAPPTPPKGFTTTKDGKLVRDPSAR